MVRKNLPPRAFDHSGKHQTFPLVFVVTGQPTYHVWVSLRGACVCACACVMHEFVSKYSLMGGRRVNWSVKVAKGRGFSEQIVAPGNSQTVPVWQSVAANRNRIS